MAAEAIDAGVPDGMTDRSGGVIDASVVSDTDAPSGKAIALDSLTNQNNKYLTWNAVPQTADVEVLMLVKAWVDDPTSSVGLSLYLRADATQDFCYVLRASPDEFGWYLNYGTDVSEFNAVTGSSEAWTEGVTQAVRWRAVGTSIQSRQWTPADLNDITADEPVSWNIDATDGNITGAEYIGIGGRQSDDTQYVLYLSATDSPSTESAPAPAPADATPPTVAINTIHGTGVLDSVHGASG